MALKIIVVFSAYFASTLFMAGAKVLPYTPGYDYSWRDYNGIVPLDAVPAGKDSDGNTFYIGQGYIHNIGLIPGTIYPGSTNLTITAQFKLHSVDKYVKILCSPRRSAFKWVLTSSTTIDSLTQSCHLVLGGTEANRDIYIGRTVHEGKLEAGKVFIYPPPELCLPISSPNFEIRYKNYEVLTFDCQKEDYYWRDYNGKVPKDAFEVGSNSHGQRFYVGQGYFHGIGLLPGPVFPQSTNLTATTNDKMYTTDKFVKILCSPRQSEFKWILTSWNAINDLANKCHLVAGGAEGDRETYIGRPIRERSLPFSESHPSLGLQSFSIAHEGNKIQYKYFEVLSYSCSEEHVLE